MRSVSLSFAAAVTVTLLTGALTGCADSWQTPHAAPTAVGAPAPGFAPSAPKPEATITPSAGSWDGVHPSAGYRVVLLTADSTAPTVTLADAVRDWARAESVDLREIGASDEHVDVIVEAMELKPDLIVSVGDDLVDPLALVTANHLDRQFLVLGAQVAEPTANVTAVNWVGASFRGEGLAAASVTDPATFTAERGGEAIRAGTTAVLTGITGVVLELD